MNVLCAGSTINLRTATALDALPRPDFSPVYAPCPDWWSYYDALAHQWSLGSTFLNIEQDIIPTLDALHDLLSCSNPWCTQPYRSREGGLLRKSLGCVKFDAKLMAEYPRLFLDLAESTDKTMAVYVSRRHWQYLDDWVGRFLRAKGYETCVHNIKVEHDLGPGQWPEEKA